MAFFQTILSAWPPLLQEVLQNGTFEGPFNVPSDELVLTNHAGLFLRIAGTNLVASDGRTISSGIITSISLDNDNDVFLSVGGFATPPAIAALQAILDLLDSGFIDATYNSLINDFLLFESLNATGDDTSNHFRGSPGVDRFFGLFGNDFLDFKYEEGPQGIEVNVASGTVKDTFGNIDTISGIEEFRGTIHNDVFRGADVLTPDEEVDRVYIGGAGNDTYYGGFGFDVISYLLDGGPAAVKVDLSKGTARDTHGDLDTFHDIDGVRGTNFADELLGDGQDNVFEGMDGSDTINGRGGQDGVDYSLERGSHGIVVNLTGDMIRNLAVPGIAITELGPNSAYDTYGNIDKLSNIEDVTGTAFADHLLGNGAHNVLRGEFGNDYLFGGGGNDWLMGGYGDDVLDGGIGDDLVDGAFGNDNLNGGNGDDILNGEMGDDQLFAGAGNDQMNGGEGNDKLIDSVGKDIFIGSTGADRFDFNKLSEMGNNAATRDVIRDMHLYLDPDKIDLATLDANTTAAGDQAFSFVAVPTTVFSGAAGDLIWSQEDLSGTVNDKTIVSGDVDGDTIADFQIELTGLVNLTANDFIL